jgi:hypothetical protein
MPPTTGMLSSEISLRLIDMKLQAWFGCCNLPVTPNPNLHSCCIAFALAFLYMCPTHVWNL